MPQDPNLAALGMQNPREWEYSPVEQAFSLQSNFVTAGGDFVGRTFTVTDFDHYEEDIWAEKIFRDEIKNIPKLQDWLLVCCKKIQSVTHFSDTHSIGVPMVTVSSQINNTSAGGNLTSQVIAVINNYYKERKLLKLDELDSLLELVLNNASQQDEMLQNLTDLAREYKNKNQLFHATYCYVSCITLSRKINQFSDQLCSETVECCRQVRGNLIAAHDLLLHRFVSLESFDVVEFLLDNQKILDIDINALAKNKTALIIACEKGLVGMVTLLFSKGADLTVHSHKETCLYAACKAGQEAVVEKLLQHSRIKDILDQKCKIDNTGDTSLHAAVGEGHLLIARRLVEAGANIQIRNNFGIPGETILTKLVWSWKCKDAVLQDELACFLVKIDPNFKEDFSERFLENVAKNGLYNFFSQYCINLVNNKNILRLIKIACNNIGEGKFSPEMREISESNLESSKKILLFLLSESKGLKLDESVVLGELERFGGNVLCYAARKGIVEVVQCVLEYYSGSELQVFDGKAALHYAAEGENDSVGVFELLFNTTPELINILSDDGMTLLHRSVQCGNVNITKFLLEKGALSDLKTNNRDKDTPLILVAKACFDMVKEQRLNRFLATAELLIKHGANITEKNGNGKTALAIQENMKGGGHEKLIQLLSGKNLASSIQIPAQFYGSSGFSKPDFTKSVDTRWFTDDEMNKLFEYYFSDKDNIRLVVGIDAYQYLGETLRQNLEDIQLQQALEESFSGLTQNMMIAPINLGNQHWSALYLYFNSHNRMEPTIGYFDPFGGVIPSVLKEVLLEVFSSLNEHNILISPIRLQRDGYNCGPWVVAILKSLVDSQGLHLPSENFDIQAKRFEYRRVLSSLLSSPAGELVSSLPPNSNLFRKSESGFVNQNASGNHVKGNLNLVSNVISQTFQAPYSRPIKKTLLLKYLEEGKLVAWGSEPGGKLPTQRNMFVGRKKLLEKLHFKFGTNNSNKKDTLKSRDELLVVCSGLGGVGKTQLVLRYLIETEEKYKLQIWFEAENIVLLEDHYIQFAKALGYESEKYLFNNVFSYINNKLAENPGWIIVYDNVENYQSIEKFLPTEKGGRILITTRHQEWPMEILPVDVMDESDSISLVETLIKTKDEKIKDLVSLLGCLPLALAQASAYISHRKMDVTDYLKNYQLQEREMLEYRRLPAGFKHDPVSVTWAVSIKAIRKDAEFLNIPPLAPMLLLVCAYFSPQNIPRKILSFWFENTYVGESVNLCDELLGQLHNYSLIDLNRGYLSIHRLVQAVLRMYHKDGSLEKILNIDCSILSLEWYSRLLMTVNFYFNQEHKMLTKNESKDLLSHFLSLLKYGDSLWENNKPKENFVLVLLFDIASIFNSIGQIRSAISYYEQALEAYNFCRKKDPFEFGKILCGIGTCYSELGEFKKGRTFLKDALKVVEKNFNESCNHEQLASIIKTLINLGNAYENGDLNEINESKDVLEYVEQIQEKYFGRKTSEMASILIGFGCIYISLGELEEQNINYFSNIFSVGNFLEEFVKNESIKNCAKKFFEVSKKKFEDALEIQEKYFPSDSRKIAEILTNLSLALSKLGELDESEKKLNYAFDILKLYEDESNHFRIGILLVFKATFYINKCETESALTSFKNGLQILIEHYGLEHLEIAKNLETIGFAYFKINQERKISKICLEYALLIFTKEYGDNAIRTEKLKNMLAKYSDDQSKISNEKFLIESLMKELEERLAIKKPHKNEGSLSDIASNNHFLGFSPGFLNDREKKAVIDVRQALQECCLKKDRGSLPSPELALRRAAASGKLKVVKTLVENAKNIDINSVGSQSKKTALDFARENGHHEVVDFLENVKLQLGIMVKKKGAEWSN